MFSCGEKIDGVGRLRKCCWVRAGMCGDSAGWVVRVLGWVVRLRDEVLCLSNRGINVGNDKQDMVAPSGQMEKLDRIGKYGAICQARTNFT